MFRTYPLKFLLGKMPTKSKISVRNYIPRRALLYVPGDDRKKIDKALGLDVDCIALDCEDGVALNRKVEARATIREFLDKGKPKGPTKFDLGVRVNSIDSGLCHEDLVSCLGGSFLPDTVLLPKVESSEHVLWFADEISHLIKAEDRINLIIYIESALAFINLGDICKTAKQLSKRFSFELVALVLGSDDLLANLGAIRTEDSKEILYARQKLVLTAKAFDLQAIDMVYINYKDLDGLKKQCEEGMRMGYTGKQVIHPGQVPVVHEAFLPTKSQVNWAEGLLKSFEEHQKSGKGAFTYRGSMIDMPTMKQAQNIMKLAKLGK
ncbi:citramalyl-CoA lyase, mitochondrial [Anoplophora glabripennis]|uniref:citramalyl-CoA lyase, mitochondrial n=1 Tax=Anoplophora glabripennis TaxID=217634 RepID=UPI0008742351|nr:citramalyl-CoA lyase, mitochondrial [Anoplophora glabripennis]